LKGANQMGIFNKFKQAKALSQMAGDPEAMRFAMIFDLIQSEYDPETARVAARTLIPLTQDPFNRQFEDSIRSEAATFAVALGNLRQLVPSELAIEDVTPMIKMASLNTIRNYVKISVAHNMTNYCNYSEWLQMKQGADEFYTNNDVALSSWWLEGNI
jgi:hypothetical protein